MSKHAVPICLWLALIISGCTVKMQTNDLLNGVLWAQTSVEFEVSVRQAFELARHNIEKALKDPHWTAALEQTNHYEALKPAVIIDVDETLLNNFPFEARLVKDGVDFEETLWQAWVNESKAAAMPGAKSFIQYLKAKGIKIFYVTNRIMEAPTVRNIKIALDPMVTAEEVLCKNEMPDWGSDKSSRRAFLARDYRIILLLGDDYNDFAFLGKAGPEERLAKARAHQHYWGKQWIIFSNPVYGHWERALYNYNHNLSAQEKRMAKRRYLNTQ